MYKYTCTAFAFVFSLFLLANASAGSNGDAPQEGQDWIITQDTHVWDSEVNVKDIVVNVNIKSGIYWFLNIFPQIILNDDIVDNKQKIQPYFTIQKAGDIVFVPCDWYHVVINLENTVAITHNFAMKRDVNKIIPRVFRDEPQFGLKWLNELRNNNQKDVEIFRQMEQYISEHKVV